MSKNAGQIAVFVLLLTLLGLTVGLSVTSRTLQDLKQTAVSDQSSRAFTAAEAGIEDALSKDLNSIASGTLSLPNTNVTYTVSRSPVAAYTPDGAVAKDDVIEIDLRTYTGNSLTINWTKKNDPREDPQNLCNEGSFQAPAALMLTFYTFDGSNYGVKKLAYNASRCGSLGALNNFDTANSAANTAYLSGANVAYTGDIKVMRIRPIYNDASITVSGNANLPAQGYTIKSTAQTTGQVSRAVEVTRTNVALPPFFDYVLYTGGNLSQ
ncbi:MAG: hypothetical protein AAB506_01470 [Patescibacteria group bacterium]